MRIRNVRTDLASLSAILGVFGYYYLQMSLAWKRCGDLCVKESSASLFCDSQHLTAATFVTSFCSVTKEPRGYTKDLSLFKFTIKSSHPRQGWIQNLFFLLNFKLVVRWKKSFVLHRTLLVLRVSFVSMLLGPTVNLPLQMEVLIDEGRHRLFRITALVECL
jgi:hypothetical protein